MSNLTVMLGGVAIATPAGLTEQTEEQIGGESVIRLSAGDGVVMSHWGKMAGTISGQGHMPPGLDGLDFRQPLELRTTQVNSIQQEELAFVLPSTPRSDKAPWALARAGGRWHPVECLVSEAGGVTSVLVTELAGADAYQVWWFPVYSVKAKRPSKSQSNMHGWSIPWEEL